MIDDLQDAINSKGNGAQTGLAGRTDDDLRNNYNQYIAGSRTHKNNNTAKNHSVVNHSASGSTALTNQTMHMFKSHGSTERVNSSTNPKSSMAETKYKKEFLKSKAASNREVVNRSAMNMKNDSMGMPLGKSPDRSKNMSVYSQQPAQ